MSAEKSDCEDSMNECGRRNEDGIPAMFGTGDACHFWTGDGSDLKTGGDSDLRIGDSDNLKTGDGGVLGTRVGNDLQTENGCDLQIVAGNDLKIEDNSNKHRTGDDSEYRAEDGNDIQTSDSEHRIEYSSELSKRDDSEYRTRDGSEHRITDGSKCKIFSEQDTSSAVDRVVDIESSNKTSKVLQTGNDSGGDRGQGISGSDDDSDCEMRHTDDGSDTTEDGCDSDAAAEENDNNNDIANSGDGGLSTDSFVGDQHSLSGPHRRRHTARQLRQHDNPASFPMQSRRQLNLPPSVLAQWRAVGRQWGAESDDDIACILMRHYEDLIAGRPPRPPPRQRCPDCGELLMPLPCGACGPHQHSARLSHDPGHGRSSEGKGGSCGRC